jgi:hypothetical protein
MTPEQLKHRNQRISEGQRRAWTDPEIRARRSASIRRVFDDPLFRAVMRRRAERGGVTKALKPGRDPPGRRGATELLAP